MVGFNILVFFFIVLHQLINISKIVGLTRWKVMRILEVKKSNILKQLNK